MKTIPKKTKIVATIGPASRSVEMIQKLLQEGVNVFRLNFSHGAHNEHKETVNMIRIASKKLGIPAGILADLQGPKIRTGRTRNDEKVELKKHAKVVITSVPAECTDTLISIDYADLDAEIRVDQTIVINDGAIRLNVDRVDKKKHRISCTVTSGGAYSSHKGVNLPKVKLAIPSLTKKDLDDLDFILSLNVQYIALSFVRTAEDVNQLKRAVKDRRPEIKLIAKIEKPEAAEAVDSILQVADGIMVARGDLGVEATPYDVPILQKTLIEKADAAHKVVIVATQMLESMIEHSLPTRAESTDVANAIFDGTDAVMLSGETAMGAYPAEAVRMMSQIANAAEQSSYFRRERIRTYGSERVSARAVCEAAAWASAELGHIPICVFTMSGDTALYLSKIRNPSLIFAFTPNIDVVNMLSLAFNVAPFRIPFRKHIADLVDDAEQMLVNKKQIKYGDRIVLISGATLLRGATNVMQIKRVAAKMSHSLQ